jgi:hypothetical protein
VRRRKADIRLAAPAQLELAQSAGFVQSIPFIQMMDHRVLPLRGDSMMTIYWCKRSD